MAYKILVADDSPTIQKVIKITLANEAFEIIECISDSQLWESFDTHKPAIVLLDFNLSEEDNGYDLCKKIKEKSPDCKVVLLYGTFDKVDDDLFNDSQASNSIIKPFDGTKFINICRSLAEELATDSPSDDKVSSSDSDEFPSIIPTEKSQPEISEEPEVSEEEDEWVMDAPNFEDDLPPVLEESLAQSSQNQLDIEAQGWGVSIPGVIGEETTDDLNIDIPEVIEQAKLTEQEEESLSFDGESALPDTSDLEYPELQSGSEDINLPSNEDLEFPEPISSEIPLTFEREEEGTDTAEDVKAIEDFISDEVEDENLWSIDEEVSSESGDIDSLEDDVPKVDQQKLNDIVAQMHRDGTHPFPDQSKTTSSSDHVSVSSDTVKLIKEQLLDEIKPLIKEYVEEAVIKYVKSSVDKVTWDVIPDLAENVIKSEIKRISDSVIDS